MAERTTRFLGVEPQFRVTDLIRTAEYYRDVLGFVLEDYFGNPPVFTQAKRDRALIQLGRADEPDHATKSHGVAGCNAYVWVDDVDRLAMEYRERGAVIVDGPIDRPYSCRELVVRDCNGLVLCFGQDTSTKSAQREKDPTSK